MKSAAKHLGQSSEEKAIAIDLFCGLGGWAHAFLDSGYRIIGFDIEVHDYGNGSYPGELVLRDIRSISGSELVKQYGVPTCIVASPPCQEFSYMAMPWKRAKQIQKALLGEGEFPDAYKGSRTISELTDLFNQCFRIQREISEACGHYVPMIIENVRGAQKWVGKARWNFGSYYLWGDVPALMPIPSNATKVPSFRFDGNGGSFQTAATNRSDGVKAGEHKWSNSFSDTLKGEGNKTVGMNWSDPTKRGQDFTRIAGMQAGGLKRPSENGRRTDPGKGARFTSRDCWNEGTKNFRPNGEPLGKNAMAKHGSKSNARKQASAEIAKIPHSLAQWIAKTFKVSL